MLPLLIARQEQVLWEFEGEMPNVPRSGPSARYLYWLKGQNGPLGGKEAAGASNVILSFASGDMGMGLVGVRLDNVLRRFSGINLLARYRGEAHSTWNRQAA